MNGSDDSRKLTIEPTPEAATRTAAELVKTILCDGSSEQRHSHIALAGGTTPHGLYQLLAKQSAVTDVPWPNVEVWFGDERDVPHDDVESNYGMAQRTLLDHLPIRPEQVHPMPADKADLSAAAAEYEQSLRQNVPAGPEGMPQLDLILLGMGADGHTASLFPGTDAVDEQDKLVTSYFVPVLGRNRMTFTFPLINAARNVIFLITGSDKAAAAAALLGKGEAPQEEFPAGRVQLSDGTLFVVMDESAARNVH